MCREEAVELSSLKSQLDQHGVHLYAVVHETLGTSKFRDYFKGELYLDEERHFYGPRERWMYLSGFIRPSVWMSGFRASNKGIKGNFKGEGRLLGGVFVVGPGEQGVMFEHRESEWGDHANLTDIMQAVQKMNPAIQPKKEQS